MNSEKNKGVSMMSILPILFGFFVMGFVDVVGLSTNYVKEDFSLSSTIANFMPLMVFIWFALFSIPTAVLMDKIGKKNTVRLSMVITVAAMILPVINYTFPYVLIAFSLLGIGNTVLQVSLNPLVASVVSKDKVASSLTLGQFIKAISSFLGPILASFAATYFDNWKLIFVIYAVVTVLSSLWLSLTHLKEDNNGDKIEHATFGSALSLFKSKTIVLLFLGIMLIVGIDVGLNTYIPQLVNLNCDIEISKAVLGSSVYFAAKTAGAFLGSILLLKIAGDKFLRYTMFVSIITFILMLFVKNIWILYSLVFIVGMCCSNVFAIIFDKALKNQPQSGSAVSALMIMGVSGGALILPLMGVVTDKVGVIEAMSILGFCMVYLALLSYKKG